MPAYTKQKIDVYELCCHKDDYWALVEINVNRKGNLKCPVCLKELAINDLFSISREKEKTPKAK